MLQKISHFIDAQVARLGVLQSQQITDERVAKETQKIFQELFGDIGQNIHVVLREQKLEVQSSFSPLSNEIFIRKQSIIQSLNKRLGKSLVKDLYIMPPR